mmetsp:Transcript_35713/g.60497  ORF Transcript_35713/g.60497 Transcript_35713/m.60497 type:complete len:525 (+) Transcript_35713:97-1671(+)
MVNDSQRGRKIPMEEAINSIGFGKAQMKLAAITGFFVAADAMEMMMLSFLGPAVKCEWNVDNAKLSLLTTVVFFGMLFGTYFWGILADRYGRWKALCYDCAFVFVFSIFSAVSPNYGTILFARAMVGFGLGGFGVSWTYFFEFIPTIDRGRWASIMMGWWSLGTVLEAALAWAIIPTLGWRWLLVISAAPLLLVFVAIQFIPESPRFYLISGQMEKATEVLEEVAQQNGCHLPEGQIKPLDDMIKPSPLEVMKIILFNPSWQRLTMCLWTLWFANGFCYYGLVLMTTMLTYHDKGNVCDNNEIFTNSDYTAVFIATAAELPGLALSFSIVDRIGRKLSQALLFGGTAVFIFVLMPLDGQTQADVAVLFFARMLITGSFTITYLYTPEVYPTDIRGTAFGYANAFARIGGMLCPFAAQDLFLGVGAWAAELLLAVMAVAATVASLYLPIETSGREMQDNLNEGSMVMKKMKSGALLNVNSEPLNPNSNAIYEEAEEGKGSQNVIGDNENALQLDSDGLAVEQNLH